MAQWKALCDGPIPRGRDIRTRDEGPISIQQEYIEVSQVQGTVLSSGDAGREGQMTDSGVSAAAHQCLSQPSPWHRAAPIEQWGSLPPLSLHVKLLTPSWGSCGL